MAPVGEKTRKKNLPEHLNISLKDFVLGTNPRSHGVSAGHAIIAGIVGAKFSHDNRITRACAASEFRTVQLENNSIHIWPPDEFSLDGKESRLGEIAQSIIPDGVDTQVRAVEQRSLRESFVSSLDELAQNVFDHSGKSEAVICALRTEFNATIAIGDRGLGLVSGFKKRMGVQSFEEAFTNGTSATNSKLFRLCEERGMEYLAFYLSRLPKVSTGSRGNRGFGLFQLDQISTSSSMYSDRFIFSAHSRNPRRFRRSRKTFSGERVLSHFCNHDLGGVGLISEYYLNLNELPERLAQAQRKLINLAESTKVINQTKDLLRKQRLREHVIERIIEV